MSFSKYATAVLFIPIDSIHATNIVDSKNIFVKPLPANRLKTININIKNFSILVILIDDINVFVKSSSFIFSVSLDNLFFV